MKDGSDITMSEPYYGCPWAPELIGPPEQTTCLLIARKYIRHMAPTISSSILEHIAETAVWNLFATRDSGDLEVLWDDRDWKWPELEGHCRQFAEFQPCIDHRAVSGADDFRRRILNTTIESWLLNQPMSALRVWQKEFGIKPAKRKVDLVGALLSLLPRPPILVYTFDSWVSEKLEEAENRRSNSEVVPVYRLLALTTAHIKAWVTVTMAWSGSKQFHNKREIRDRQSAKERFSDVKSLTLINFKTDLENEFSASMGTAWRKNNASQRVFNRSIKQMEKAKASSVDDFFEEISSFMKDVFRLEVKRCPICIAIGQPAILNDVDRGTDIKAESLPPFHPSCECAVDWCRDWGFTNTLDSHRSNYNRVFGQWASENIKGLSVRMPTVEDRVKWEEATMLDEALNAAVKEKSWSSRIRNALQRIIKAG